MSPDMGLHHQYPHFESEANIDFYHGVNRMKPNDDKGKMLKYNDQFCMNQIQQC